MAQLFLPTNTLSFLEISASMRTVYHCPRFAGCSFPHFQKTFFHPTLATYYQCPALKCIFSQPTSSFSAPAYRQLKSCPYMMSPFLHLPISQFSLCSASYQDFILTKALKQILRRLPVTSIWLKPDG